MQYEPIKRSLGRFFSKSLFLRKILYLLIDLLLLRTWHVKKALSKLSKILPPESSVLDAGSGFGQYAWRISCMYKHWKIKAIDINREQIEDCNKFIARAGRSDRVKFEISDLTTFSDINFYDFILTVDVMEHIKEDNQVFLNFYRALKKKGILLITTPSDKGGSDVHHNTEVSFIDEHVRAGYSIEEISCKLSAAGFRKTEVKYIYGKSGKLSWLLSMKYPVKMLNLSYLFFILLPLYYLVAFPLSIILNIVDVHFKNKSGTGLLVIAEK